MAETLPLIAVVAKTKRILRKAGAISEETAKTANELSLPEKWLRTPEVVRTEDGRYILNAKMENTVRMMVVFW